MIEGLYDAFKYWAAYGTVWIYSDTHFNEDEDLKIPFPDRPAAEEHIRMINSKVGKRDTLILLGDVGDVECAKKLKGYKILITGNHDLGCSNYKSVFNEVYGGPLIISPKIILSHEPLDIDWAFNVHGHTHHNGFDRPGHLCVCSDVVGYTPVNFNQFVKSGRLSEVTPLHRITIDKATERKKLKNK